MRVLCLFCYALDANENTLRLLSQDWKNTHDYIASLRGEMSRRFDALDQRLDWGEAITTKQCGDRRDLVIMKSTVGYF